MVVVGACLLALVDMDGNSFILNTNQVTLIYNGHRTVEVGLFTTKKQKVTVIHTRGAEPNEVYVGLSQQQLSEEIEKQCKRKTGIKLK